MGKLVQHGVDARRFRGGGTSRSGTRCASRSSSRHGGRRSPSTSRPSTGSGRSVARVRGDRLDALASAMRAADGIRGQGGERLHGPAHSRSQSTQPWTCWSPRRSRCLARGLRSERTAIASIDRTYVKMVKDPAGIEMAKLARRAWPTGAPGIEGADEPSRRLIREGRAERRWDWPLLAARISLWGRLLTIRGLAGEAREEFERAVHIAHEHNSPGIAWYAARQLDEGVRVSKDPLAFMLFRSTVLLTPARGDGSAC